MIYFRDPNANLQQISPPFKIKEDVYIAGKSMEYDLRSKVKIQLADDPRTVCKDYKMFGQYEDCKDEEMRDIFQSLMGCVPFWFTDQPGREFLSSVQKRELSCFLVIIYTAHIIFFVYMTLKLSHLS